MEEKEILYKGEALLPKSPKDTILSLAVIAALWVAVSFLANRIYYGWLLTLAAIVISAVFINKLLNKGTFKKTYILYEDKLVVMTRYGFVEKDSSAHPLKTSEFTENYIVTDGVKYPFYPDETLKEILKIKTAS